MKTGSVWAEQAAASGSVATKEGSTRYESGDWLVCNEEGGSDSYAISAGKFAETYEPDG